MIEIIKTFFGNSVSAVEAFCGVVSVGSILAFFSTIFFIVYKGKKLDKAKEQLIKETKEEIDRFKKENEEAITTLKKDTKQSIDNLCNMFLLEATKQGVDLDKFNAIVNIYKNTISYEMLDTDKLEAEKKQEIEETQTKQESVNENLDNINKVLNDIV